MNELLQKHGCSNVFSVPEGLKELMADISREVLREQPTKIFDFIANYLSVLIITREHGILAMRILDDLCDCKPTVSEHLMQLGMEREQAESVSQVIKEEIEGFQPTEGKEKVKEAQIIKKILVRSVLDEDMTARVCQVARNAYKDYWYRKKLLERNMKVQPDEPWEIAAQRTLDLYKQTKPSFSDLTRATEKIQAAYRGYYVRKNLLSHLKTQPKKMSPKVDMLGPPADIAESREIDLGPIIDLQIHEDDVGAMFDDYATEQLGLQYDPMKTVTHLEDDELLTNQFKEKPSRLLSQIPPLTKSVIVADTKSRQSRVEDVEDLQQIRSLSQTEASRQNRQSQAENINRPSRLASMVREPDFQESSLHRISFLEAPPEILPDMESQLGATTTQVADEVQEAPGIEPAKTEDFEFDENLDVKMQEVPEEIPDNITDDEGEDVSAPTATVPSLGTDTAENTDVEFSDGLQDTSGDEEGE